MLSTSGFASPAQGYEANDIDLNTLLIKNKPASFFMRMTGFSLSEKNILEGDILIIDKSLRPSPGKLVVFQAEGRFFCREMVKTTRGFFIRMEENNFIATDRVIFFGVVTAVVRQL